jgi:hypothetical protein
LLEIAAFGSKLRRSDDRVIPYLRRARNGGAIALCGSSVAGSVVPGFLIRSAWALRCERIANSPFAPISQSIECVNEENVMRMPGHNNHRQLSVAGWGPRQPERGVQERNDHEYAMKKTLISGALALLVLTYPAHASAQQATAADKAGQFHQQTAEASFMAENKAAMNKMMMDMAVKPSGNVDADFTAMMIPHHQGAVDMAEAELRYSHNRQFAGSRGTSSPGSASRSAR